MGPQRYTFAECDAVALFYRVPCWLTWFGHGWLVRWELSCVAWLVAWEARVVQAWLLLLHRCCNSSQGHTGGNKSIRAVGAAAAARLQYALAIVAARNW